MKEYSFSEWMFLRYLASNLNGRIFKELLEKMAIEILARKGDGSGSRGRIMGVRAPSTSSSEGEKKGS